MWLMSGCQRKVWKRMVLTVSCFVTFVVGNALRTILGQDGATRASPSLQTETINGDHMENFLYDAGEVVAGTVVSHAFVICNDWDETIEIRKSDDIVLHCGCSSIEPAMLRLTPGQSTDITVKLRTMGRDGVFVNGGDIIWTGARGKQRKLHFTLRVKVEPALRVSDQMLVFDDEEEPQTNTKEIIFTASKAPILWDSLMVTVSLPFQLEKLDRGRDRMRCVVTHPKESEREEVVGRIEAVGRLRGKRGDEGEFVSATAGLLWRPRQDDLRISPKIVPLTFGADGCGRARLYIRGKKVEKNPRLIRSVDCQGYSVKWTALPTAAGKAQIVELNLVPTPGLKRPDKPMLRVDLQKSRPVELPVSVTGREDETTR